MLHGEECPPGHFSSAPDPEPRQPEDPWDDVDDDDQSPTGDPPLGEPPMELPSKREDPDEAPNTFS